jgi:hypothetical protein
MDMANEKNCKRKRIAESGTFHVDLCKCGVVHLTIGCLTLRLDPSAYRELAVAIHESLLNLESLDGPTMH